MTQLTALPTRHLAEIARISQQERDTEQNGVSVAQLLHVLRAKFDQDEKVISGNLLHYQDAILEPQSQKPRVHFTLRDESPEANEERKHRVYPATPQRPDPEALAKLMEVSYTEWSDSTYEDTTGDSKLAEWLASFANKDLPLRSPVTSTQGSLPSSTLRKPSLHDTSVGAGVENSLDSDQFQPFFLPAFTPASDTPYSRRHILVNVGQSPRRRALSDPPSLAKRETHQSYTRSHSISHTTLSQKKTQSFHRVNFEDETRTDDSSGVASFIKPGAFSPFSLKFIQPPEASDSSQPIASMPITPSTPDFELSPLHFLRSSSLVPGTPLRHLVPFDYPDDEPSVYHTPSNGNGLADLSGVYAFNLSSQHTAKSPFLIRTWKRMLGELAGRFPLSLSDYTSNGALIEKGGAIEQLQLEASFADGIQEPGLSSPQSLPGLRDSNTIEMPPITKSRTPDIPRLKTYADVLLDREYASYLRSSISARQKEICCLQGLIAQREKTIERMEFALKRRALDVLGSHET